MKPIRPESTTEMAPLVDLAKRLQSALHVLGGWNAYPGGQVEEDGIWWCPSDADDWGRGGAGSPVPRLDDPVTVLTLVALVRQERAAVPVSLVAEIGRAVTAWLTGEGTIKAVAELVVPVIEALAYYKRIGGARG